MASGQLTVYNATLSLLHQSPLSTPTPNPTTEASRLLNANWQDIVFSCLEQADWNFAQVRGQLSQSSATPAYGFSYFYEIPADALRFSFVSQTGVEQDLLLRFHIEQGRIATDAATLYATWVSSTAIDAPGRWSALFGQYVAAELAARCIKLNISAKDDVAKEVKRCKKLALGIDGIGDPPAFRQPGSWVRGIRTGSRQFVGEQGGVAPPPFN